MPSSSTAMQAMIVGFLGYGASFVLLVLALRGLGPARTAAYFSTAPFGAAGIAIAFWQEPTTPPFWVAAAILMGLGVWLHLTERHEHQHILIGTSTNPNSHAAAGSFYQRKGLLPEPTKPYGSIRRYGASGVARVRFVKSAQRLGFSLDEIAGLLLLDDGTHCDEARELGEKKLAAVRGKLADSGSKWFWRP